MNVYWHKCGHATGNLGDRLTPLLFDYFNIPVKWTPPNDAQVFGIGSIVQMVPKHFRGAIWSSGLLSPCSSIDLSEARVLGVRGKLTLNNIKLSDACQVTLGDGGLLSYLFGRRCRIRYKVGLIPHYSEFKGPEVTRLSEHRDVKVIDICRDLSEVIDEITACEGILSSSLHGLIMAESLRRPCRWMDFGSGNVLGNGFKFRDYYSNFGLEDIAPIASHSIRSIEQLLAAFDGYRHLPLDELQGGLLEGIKDLARERRYWQLGLLPVPVREQTVLNSSPQVRGRPLSKAKDTLRQDSDTLGRFFVACLKLLSSLHDRGIVHRQISLERISIVAGTPRLHDFGWAIAEVFGSDAEALFRKDIGDMSKVFRYLNSYEKYNSSIEIMAAFDQDVWPGERSILSELFESARLGYTRTPSKHRFGSGMRGSTEIPAPMPFIVGTGRCGTTLLRLMLDAHPDLAIPPETHFVPAAIKAHSSTGCERKAFVEAVCSSRTWPDFHLDAQGFESIVDQLQPFNVGDGLRLFYRAYADRFGKSRCGDKTPGYATHMKTIQDVLPEAHFIHLVRDGRDVALSVREVFFGPSDVQEAAHWWAHAVSEARYQAQGLTHFLEMKYEDLVLVPEDNLRHVCDFLELPWDPCMLEYFRRATSRLNELEKIKGGAGAGQRRDIHKLTRESPQPSRVARWKAELTVSERVSFESVAGEVLLQLGYELSTDTVPDPAPIVWTKQLDEALVELEALVPPNSCFVLLDQAELGEIVLKPSRRSIPFPNHDGEYWAPPEDDADALRELEQVLDLGPTHLVIAWPAFWWLEHYKEFIAHLDKNFRRVADNSRLVVFQLSSNDSA